MTSEQVAGLLGIKPGSVYRYRVRKAIPEPDETLGRTPLWKKETIDEWLKSRPGHGWRKGKTDKKATR